MMCQASFLRNQVVTCVEIQVCEVARRPLSPWLQATCKKILEGMHFPLLEFLEQAAGIAACWLSSRTSASSSLKARRFARQACNAAPRHGCGPTCWQRCRCHWATTASACPSAHAAVYMQGTRRCSCSCSGERTCMVSCAMTPPAQPSHLISSTRALALESPGCNVCSPGGCASNRHSAWPASRLSCPQRLKQKHSPWQRR